MAKYSHRRPCCGASVESQEPCCTVREAQMERDEVRATLEKAQAGNVRLRDSNRSLSAEVKRLRLAMSIVNSEVGNCIDDLNEGFPVTARKALERLRDRVEEVLDGPVEQSN